jgi:tripartite-type tricarboxylate transporter receptor subunit TctC
MPSSTTVLLAALLLAGAGGAAQAQTYPSATVKLIVPVPAGGVTDTMARIVAQRLTEAWGQPVVVDNRPGGNYAVGAQVVAKSPPTQLSPPIRISSASFLTIRSRTSRPSSCCAVSPRCW